MQFKFEDENPRSPILYNPCIDEDEFCEFINDLYYGTPSIEPINMIGKDVLLFNKYLNNTKPLRWTIIGYNDNNGVTGFDLWCRTNTRDKVSFTWKGVQDIINKNNIDIDPIWRCEETTPEIVESEVFEMCDTLDEFIYVINFGFRTWIFETNKCREDSLRLPTVQELMLIDYDAIVDEYTKFGNYSLEESQLQYQYAIRCNRKFSFYLPKHMKYDPRKSYLEYFTLDPYVSKMSHDVGSTYWVKDAENPNKPLIASGMEYRAEDPNNYHAILPILRINL